MAKPVPAIKIGYMSGSGAVIHGQGYSYTPKITGERGGSYSSAIFLQVGRQHALIGTMAVHPPGQRAALLAAYPGP